MTSKIAALAMLLLALFMSPLAIASEQTNLLAQAAKTAQNMRSDPAFGPARNMVPNAKGILIIPGLVKGGFIFGAEGGNGVLVRKTSAGWGQPAFYTMGSASFGLQIGLEKAEIVMLIMSDKALTALQSTGFKFGAGGGLTIVTLSAGAEAATNLNGDIIVWTSATGAYGGLTLNGSVIDPRDEWNKDFYGRNITVQDIMAGKARSAQSAGLRSELARLNGPARAPAPRRKRSS